MFACAVALAFAASSGLIKISELIAAEDRTTFKGSPILNFKRCSNPTKDMKVCKEGTFLTEAKENPEFKKKGIYCQEVQASCSTAEGTKCSCTLFSKLKETKENKKVKKEWLAISGLGSTTKYYDYDFNKIDYACICVGD